MKRVQEEHGFRMVADSDPRPHVPTRAQQRRAELSRGQTRKRNAAPTRFALAECPHLGEPLPDLNQECGCKGARQCNLFNEPCVHGWANHKKVSRYCRTCKEHPSKKQLPAPLPPAAADPARVMLLTGGLGDVVAVESLMSPEERERIDTIYYACPWIAELRAIFTALPNFPNVKQHVELTPKRTYYQKSDVEAAHGPLPPLTDYSILKIFPQRRAYTGSSLLAYPLADNLPTFDKPYMVVVPTSRWGRWNDRDFSESDWRTCIGYLDRHDMLGVMLFNGNDYLREHPRLVNLQNKTSILETVELLKRAAGYIGIDSALSVLAAKLFPVKRLAIKSVWKHCYEHKAIYYAPHRDFRFLQRRIAL